MYARASATDYPDAVKSIVRVQPDNDLVTYNNISFNEKKVVLVDGNFFSFFSFPPCKRKSVNIAE